MTANQKQKIARIPLDNHVYKILFKDVTAINAEVKNHNGFIRFENKPRCSATIRAKAEDIVKLQHMLEHKIKKIKSSFATETLEVNEDEHRMLSARHHIDISKIENKHSVKVVFESKNILRIASASVGSTKLKLFFGDMLKTKADALVNAANTKLQHDGGIAKAIATKAGMELTDECENFISNNGPLAVGSSMVTTAGKLGEDKIVIHTVGPYYSGNASDDEPLLRNAVSSALNQAVVHKKKKVAMPAISCGIFNYPLHQALPIICDEVKNFCNKNKSLEEVLFFVDRKV